MERLVENIACLKDAARACNPDQHHPHFTEVFKQLARFEKAFETKRTQILNKLQLQTQQHPNLHQQQLTQTL